MGQYYNFCSVQKKKQELLCSLDRAFFSWPFLLIEGAILWVTIYETVVNVICWALLLLCLSANSWFPWEHPVSGSLLPRHHSHSSTLLSRVNREAWYIICVSAAECVPNNRLFSSVEATQKHWIAKVKLLKWLSGEVYWPVLMHNFFLRNKIFY